MLRVVKSVTKFAQLIIHKVLGLAAWQTLLAILSVLCCGPKKIIIDCSLPVHFHQYLVHKNDHVHFNYQNKKGQAP